MSLGVAGLSKEDCMLHLLNFVWPNIFETSPHVIAAVFEAIGGMRMALGPTSVFQYVLQVASTKLALKLPYCFFLN